MITPVLAAWLEQVETSLSSLGEGDPQNDLANLTDAFLFLAWARHRGTVEVSKVRSYRMDSMDSIDAKNMSPGQKILAMETLWESMCQEEEEPAAPDWHGQILENRRARIAAQDARFITLEQLRERLGR